MRIKPVRFPKDESKHDDAIEWWYFNGNLKDKKGNRYAYMDCLFRAKTKKVNLPFLRNYPFKTIHFSHSIISDIKNKKTYPTINYILSVSKDSFTKKQLFINYANPISINNYINSVIEEPKNSVYHIKTDSLDLHLRSMKKPLLEDGKGFIQLKNKNSYYYSLTDLETTGTITVKGKEIKVKGKSWFDHQWSNSPFKKDKWTWFSIQLDNSTELVCFEFDNGKNKTSLATISYQNSKQVSAKDVFIIPEGLSWKSKKTGAKYPLSWHIEIPSKRMSFDISPVLKNQELLFGNINYWEGPIEVKGRIGCKNVKGEGFMELVGIPMGISDAKLAGDTALAIAKKISRFVKRKGESFIKKRIENIKKTYIFT